MDNFWEGFEKRAGEGAAALGAAAALAGLGAFTGHAAHVQKKLIHARQGKEYKEKSFIDRHPYLTGAATAGLAPAHSLAAHQRELDRGNKDVRKVMNEHPLMTMGM